MATVTGPGLPGLRISLFEHAQRLHAGHPHSPLPDGGYPFPDDPLHPRRRSPSRPEPHYRAGAEAAAILDRHFARPHTEPAELELAFHDVYVPIHWNEHIVAAAWRVDADRARETGRWLAARSRDRCSATIGLALLAASQADAADIPLIRTIGLLSRHFGPLAVRALQRSPGIEALPWLAERVSGWGRVHAVEALCDSAPRSSRSWLLRRACDGDFLNGYFAGKVATAAHLHEAITGDDTDDELIDHTSRLLHAMTSCSGMGMTLATYPPSRAVIAAHARLLGTQHPAFGRWVGAALLAGRLAGIPGEDGTGPNIGFTAAERQHLADTYTSVLNQADWTATAKAGLNKEDHDRSERIAQATSGIRLHAFTGPRDRRTH